MNYLPTCTSRLVVQHTCQVSFKSMKGCRRSWEDKLKCVKILSVKDHNSAKICRTWIISPHALVDLWYTICTKFHSNPCKDVGGVEKTNFDATEWRNDGRTEWRNDWRTDKANTKCPLAILWRGHKKWNLQYSCKCLTDLNDTPYSYIIWIYKHTIWKSASNIEYKENWPGPNQVSRLLNHATTT